MLGAAIRDLMIPTPQCDLATSAIDLKDQSVRTHYVDIKRPPLNDSQSFSLIENWLFTDLDKTVLGKMSIATFELPKWIEGRAPVATHNLCGSASPALQIKDLIALSNDPRTTATNLDFTNLSLKYNSATTGQATLKTNIASQFESTVDAEHIVTTAGTSLANHLVFQSLLRAGDHVICVHPTYAQLYAEPRALGVEVSFWRHRRPDNWALDFSELEELIRKNTRMIIVNNPNNPTGTYLDDKIQQRIVEVAKKYDLTVLADEIFRPLFHFSSKTTTPAVTKIPKSFLDVAYDLGYPKVIVTGSMSKSRSFPGLRAGWIISRDTSIVTACTNFRFYALNSLSPIDEMIASEALSTRCYGEIKRRNLETARKGLGVLEEFINSINASKKRYLIDWVKPPASSTTLIRVMDRTTSKALDDVKLCQALCERAKLLLVPASLCFDMLAVSVNETDRQEMRGWMRVGFVLDDGYLRASLNLLGQFLEDYDEEQTAKL